MIYVIPTPIGNIEDITIRAKRLLAEVSVLICEDSRETRKLLTLLDINNKPQYIDIIRNHEFNHRPIHGIFERSKHDSIDIGIVCDSGTPGISDPAFVILNIAQQMGLSYSVLPGATAFVPALVASNVVSKDFVFLGFLPTKKGRKTALDRVKASDIPVVLYESVHRINKLLLELHEILPPDRKIMIGRELSKKFEEYVHMTVKDIPSFQVKEKGEFVVVIEGV